MMPLSEMNVGETGRVVGFEGNVRALRAKLLALGLTPGTECHLYRVAPLGDPLELRVRGFALSLRKSDAARVRVEICAP